MTVLRAAPTENAARDEVAGHAAAEKVSGICGDKRDPEGQQPRSSENPRDTR